MTSPLSLPDLSSDRYVPPGASGSGSKLRGYKWLCLALILFLCQTVPYLSHRWVTDESWYAGPGYSISLGHGIRDPAIGPNDIENHLDVRPPGTALLIGGFFKVFGVGQDSARLGSVLAGLLIVFLIYRLAWDVLGEEGAVIATLLIATDNLVVLSSRTARPEALTTMAILLSLLAMKQYARKGALGWALLSGLTIAGGTMFHITLLGYILSFGVLALLIDRNRQRFALRGALAYAAGFAAGLVPFAIWILTTSLGRKAFQQEFLSRAVHTPLLAKFVQEGRRYSDLFGFNMLHGHGLAAFPVRLPIPLLFFAATFLLWKYRRRLFYLELLLLLPSIFWLIYTVNKSSRYLTLLAPVFALAIGAAVAATQGRPRLHRVMLSLAALVVIAQMGANAYLLRAARKADYSQLTAQLHGIIPPGATVYGTITFWLALHDQPFLSYERTSPWMAANVYHARYFILGDRTMTSGDEIDPGFYRELNQQLAEVVAHSIQVGHIQDPYYGDLKVYQLQP